MIVVEEDSRLSRAIAVLLVAGAMGCTLNRFGLEEHVAADTRLADSASDDAPPGTDRPADVGGTGGQIGQLGAGGGGGAAGAGGAGDVGGAAGEGSAGAAGAGGAIVADAASDVPDAAGDALADGRPDAAGVDAPPDVVTCGASPLCNSATAVTLPGGRFTGSTSGASTDRGSCGGDQAPEAVFKLVLTERSDVFVTTHGTAFDTVIYMRNDCCGAEIGCNDEADGRHTSVLAVRGLAAGTYDIFVDGAKASERGAFTVDIYATPTSTRVTDNCGSPARISNLAITGTTCGLDDDVSPLAGCLVAPATTAADAVFYFVLDAESTVVAFNTCSKTCIDTVLFMRDVCTTQTTQRACNDDFCSPAPVVPPAMGCPPQPRPVQSRTTATLGPGVHYLFLDSHVAEAAPTCGPFTITPTGVPQ